MSADEFQLQDLANIVCDFFVNAGTHATLLLQQILNSVGAHIIEDGIIGAATITALNASDSLAVYRQFRQGRINYYQNLGKKFPRFLNGWLDRVNAFPNL